MISDGATHHICARKDLLIGLADALSFERKETLVGSTSWANIIHWPAQSAGEPLYDWFEDNDPNRLKRWLKRKMGIGTNVYTQQIRDHLAN